MSGLLVSYIISGVITLAAIAMIAIVYGLDDMFDWNDWDK